jgi:hypothetical protein
MKHWHVACQLESNGSHRSAFESHIFIPGNAVKDFSMHEFFADDMAHAYAMDCPTGKITLNGIQGNAPWNGGCTD